MLFQTRGTKDYLWVVLFHCVTVDASVRHVRGGCVLLYDPQLVSMSIVILSDDLISLENYY